MNAAVFMLTATLFIWIIDARVLNQDVMAGELKKAGVSQELTNLLPEMFSSDQKNSTPQEVQDLKDNVSSAIPNDYVAGKIDTMTSSIITFIKDGEPDPVINLSDFPKLLEAKGVNVEGDFADNFAKPIEINQGGKLRPLADGYKFLSLLKYAGLVLFGLIMLAEWFVTEKGKKLKRVSRIFLYSGLWFLLYWGLIILLPKVFGDTLRSTVQANYDASGFIDAIIKVVQGLFSVYFLGFAIIFLSIAAILFVIRHFIHGDVAPQPNTDTPIATPLPAENTSEPKTLEETNNTFKERS